jgi:hypothetical protein
MARDNQGFVCHNHDSMVSYEIHHVWPIGYHGPNIASNKIKICCNAHSDIHYLMEAILRGKPYNAREYGPTIRAYAHSGADQVLAYGAQLSRQMEMSTP